MKIALVIERMDLFRGGRERSTAQVASHLAARGHEVTVLCQSGAWEADGVRVERLGRGGLSRTAQLNAFVRDVSDATAGRRFDIVHATLPVPGANVYQPRGGTIPGQIAAGMRRWGRLGFLRRGLGEMNRRRRRLGVLERALVEDRRTLCLAVSEMVGREFATHYDRREGVRVIYNAVDVPEVDAEEIRYWRQRQRYRLGVGPDDPVFLIVAGNFALKGVADSIVAFARWYHRRRGSTDPRLIVVGGGNPEPYERHAALRDVGRAVHFAGPAEEIFPWYSTADACLLLSWYDPCSRVVLEAVRWGVPAITTACNGAGELLSRTGAGIVVASPKDTKAVVAALDELADPQRRAARAAACAAAGEHVSMQRHVSELLGAYSDAARTG